VDENTLNQMQAWVLPWTKANHPDWYKATLKVAADKVAFHKYLIRLVEVRWQEEPGARETAPVTVLEQTGLVIRLKDKGSGEVLEFAGVKVEGRARAIAELAWERDEWEVLENARKEWDLVYAKRA
jgi:hypothetical protein